MERQRRDRVLYCGGDMIQPSEAKESLECISVVFTCIIRKLIVPGSCIAW